MNRYYSSLTDAFKKFILPILESRKEEAAVVYINRLLALDGPNILDKASTLEGQFLGRVSVGAFEIYGSYESVLDAEVYIRRFPFGRTRISKSRYMTHVIEDYLNNVYILKLRIKEYLKLLEELYAKGARRKEVRKITQPLFRYNSQFFEHIVDIRGNHVHSERYSDEELKRLQMMESAIAAKLNSSWSPYLETYFEAQYQRIRKKKMQEIQSLNAAIKKVVDALFSNIHPIVFDERGNLIFPSDMK